MHISSATDRTAGKQVGGLPESGSLTSADLAWLWSKTALPIMLKGVLHEEDAKLAVKAGMDGIIVSNHGGRELDTVPATNTVLPWIIKAVGVFLCCWCRRARCWSAVRPRNARALFGQPPHSPAETWRQRRC